MELDLELLERTTPPTVTMLKRPTKKMPMTREEEETPARQGTLTTTSRYSSFTEPTVAASAGDPGSPDATRRRWLPTRARQGPSAVLGMMLLAIALLMGATSVLTAVTDQKEIMVVGAMLSTGLMLGTGAALMIPLPTRQEETMWRSRP